ncbi:lactonohydrolase [Pseudomassariella vexata]|uniref:Lactonohydrolase n=1 Tax=Pseudomassariella vexata TaxID=1141098 RepID=A0A1Y2DTT5_9PEZI|nr:lactonohydrolase [Pseudomassariella vexata]ORY62688.1 lactonohydrolase [Pseudomassariella vexata]
MAAAVLALGIILFPASSFNPFSRGVRAFAIPPLAQVVDQKSFNVLETVLPPAEANSTSGFVWPGVTEESLNAKPFHIYDDEFYDIIGSDPTLTIVASSDTNPLFHEAVVWYPPTDEVFFVQNAGASAAGTGLNKSAIIQKISLAEADAVKSKRIATGNVTVTVVPSTPQVINPNGATNYKGQIIFAGEGQGDTVPSALYLMNPVEPYNTTVLVNNYFGRQFNSLNDIAIHPTSKDIYFTDTLYGYLQDFRPVPGLRNQVYRLNEATGAVTVVADGFTLPNGLTFSPNGEYAYVTDTGINHGLLGFNLSDPSSIYRYDVKEDGTWENRKTFAFVAAGVPDGVHCDSKGNVYGGCGDGVHVWNPSGKLLGKIYTGTTTANFNFAGDGRMVVCGETQLLYVTLAASGAPIS